MSQTANPTNPPYIPVHIIQFILRHRRDRLAELAAQQTAASGQDSQSQPITVPESTPPPTGGASIQEPTYDIN